MSVLICGCEKKVSAPPPLDTILNTGEVTMITYNNSNCYYQNQDQFMGFEYEMAKAFANYIGVELKVKTGENQEELFALLKDTPGGFIAANLPRNMDKEKHVLFSDEYMTIQQHIVVHRDNQEVKTSEDLAGKTVHIGKDTPYQKTLENLKAQGIDLEIKIHEDAAEEELIGMIDGKEIDITIVYNNTAMLNRRYYPKISIAGAVGEKESLGWAVPLGGKKLLKRINTFFKNINKGGRFSKIYNRYYGDIEIFDDADMDKYQDTLNNKLPKYLSIIKKAAEEHDFDWRLISSVIYQESHFNPKARSSSGAYGLMQITRSTGKLLNIRDLFDPEENIEAGTRYLRILYDFYDKAEGEDRLYIALAAYNIGQGHLLDARNLAESMGLDPNKWSSLSKTLPLLMESKYYKKSLYGYCRGTEPVQYIRKIMVYYDILKHRDFSVSQPVTIRVD